jgi:D-threo-aldose 1-dehydrogenase
VFVKVREVVKVGDPPVSVTRLGFGGGPAGNLFTAVSDEAIDQAMTTVWDSGARYFDTAPFYGLGLSEHRVGRFLRSRPRNEFVLSSKVGRLLKPVTGPVGRRRPEPFWDHPLEFEIRFDYSYEGIRRSHEDSLQRLGLSSVDFLFIHDLDLMFHRGQERYDAYFAQLVTGGFDALRDLRNEGKVKAIGAGINVPGGITKLLDVFDLDIFLVAGPYTLVSQKALDPELARCEREGVRVIIGAPLRGGLLALGAKRYQESRAGGAAAPEDLERVAGLEAVCAKFDVPLEAAALQFPLGHPTVASVLVGLASVDQAKSAISAFEHPIPGEFWDQLKAQSLIDQAAPVPSG